MTSAAPVIIPRANLWGIGLGATPAALSLGVLAYVLAAPLVTPEHRVILGLATALLGEVLVLWGALMFLRTRENVRDFLMLHRTTLRWGVLAAALALATMATFAALQRLILSRGGAPLASNTVEGLSNAPGGATLVVLLVFTPLVIPLAEELFFRGLVFTSLLRASPPGLLQTWGAPLLASIPFALIHFQGFSSFMDLFILGWTFALGFFLCLLRLRCSSIVPGMIFHCLYNLGPSLAILALLLR